MLHKEVVWLQYQEIAYKDSIIAAYGKITGVQADSIEKLYQIADNKKAIEDQEKLEAEQREKALKKELRAAKFRNVYLPIIGAGLGLGAGMLIK